MFPAGTSPPMTQTLLCLAQVLPHLTPSTTSPSKRLEVLVSVIAKLALSVCERACLQNLILLLEAKPPTRPFECFASLR